MFSLTSHLAETGHSGFLLSRDDAAAWPWPWPVTCRTGSRAVPLALSQSLKALSLRKLPAPRTSGFRVEDFKVKGVVSSSPPPFKAQSFSSALTPSPSGFHPHFSMTHMRSLLPASQGTSIRRIRPSPGPGPHRPITGRLMT